MFYFLPSLQYIFDEDYIWVRGVVEVYPRLYFSEQDLIFWFHNVKLVPLSVITDSVLIYNPGVVEDVVYGALVKPHCTVSFTGDSLHDPALPGVTVNRDI